MYHHRSPASFLTRRPRHRLRYGAARIALQHGAQAKYNKSPSSRTVAGGNNETTTLKCCLHGRRARRESSRRLRTSAASPPQSPASAISPRSASATRPCLLPLVKVIDRDKVAALAGTPPVSRIRSCLT